MRPPFRHALASAWQCRCPNCRQGSLFDGWFNKMLPQCPHCGLSYFRESGYYVGGMIITFALTAFVLIAVYLFLLLLPDAKVLSENTKFALWIVFAILLTVAFVRLSYSLWLSLDFWIDPWRPDDSK